MIGIYQKVSTSVGGTELTTQLPSQARVLSIHVSRNTGAGGSNFGSMHFGNSSDAVGAIAEDFGYENHVFGYPGIPYDDAYLACVINATDGAVTIVYESGPIKRGPWR